MDRMRAPTEFGFPTSPFIPPEHPRPVWKTLLFGALLSLIPIVGPAMSAVYVDRRSIPGTYDVTEALKTAILQAIAVLLLAIVVWLILVVILGFSVQFNPRFGRDGG